MTNASPSASGIRSPVKLWGESEDTEESTSVFDLKEVLANEFVEDLIEKSCSVEYTKGDPLDGYGDDDLDPDSYCIDGEVAYSLELKKYALALKQLIALAQSRISAPSSQPQQRLPEAPLAPQRPSSHLKHPLVHPLGFLPPRHTPFTLGQGSPPEELCLDSCLHILTRSIAALAAHSGWDASMSETLFVFRDAVDDFLRRFTGMLRVAVDQEALQRSNNFPDPVEQVFQTMGLGSIRDLHTYYQVQILGKIQRMENICSQLTSEYVELADSYNTSLPSSSAWENVMKQEVSEIEEGDEGDEDVPQLHFPSTSDGDMSLQPSATLQTGFEMLHSLERQQLLSEEDNVDEYEEDRKVEANMEMISSSSSHPTKKAKRM